MKKKSVKRVLSLLIAMVMVVGSIPMTALPAVAATTQNTPLAYASASNGDLLYTVNFSSSNFKTTASSTAYVKNVTAAGALEQNSLKIDYADSGTKTDQRYVGWLKDYSLVNSTYTIDLDFTRTNSKAKIYFGYGGYSFTTTSDVALGIEVTNSGFRWMEQSTANPSGSPAFTNGHAYKNGNTSKFKIVLSGGAISSNKVNVSFKIYSTGSHGLDILHGQGTYVMPSANAYIHLGIGEYNALASGQYYSISNVNIYKGDVSYGIDDVYDSAKYGDTLFTLDPKGLSESNYKNVDGYNWEQRNSTLNGAKASNGVITVTSATEGMHGFNTTHPFGNKWNYGHYTMEFELNCANRSLIHVLNLGESLIDRAGFGFGANLEGTTSNTGSDFGRGGNFVSSTDSELTKSGAKLYVYNSSVVRAVASGTPNVKIEFDCDDKIVTMFEKEASSENWVKVSAIDYSAVTSPVTAIFSAHAWNPNSNVTIANVKYIKGLTVSNPYYDFETKYDAAEYGSTLYSLDFSEKSNNVWQQRDSGAVLADGVLTVNSSTQGKQGIKTNMAFGEEWDYGYYTMLLTVNSTLRCGIHLFDTKTVKRIGFGLGGNLARPNGETDWNYNGQDFGQEGNLINKGATNSAENVGVVFETYAPSTVRKDTSSTGEANVKIEFNGVDKTLTLFELDTESKWVKVSSIDYSKVTEETNPIFSVHAWNVNSNIKISNVSYIKGLSETHLVSLEAADVKTDVKAGYSAEDLAAFQTSYATKYNLEESKIAGWTVDGTNVADVQAIYDAMSHESYAPKTIKLVPLMTYDAVSESNPIDIRGIRYNSDGLQYKVNVVSAIGADLTSYSAFGYEIVKNYKAADDSAATSVPLDDVVTRKVYTWIKSGDAELTAASVGGDYIVSITIVEEAFEDGTQADYIVTPFAYDKEGAKIYGETEIFTFIGGVYSPSATPLELVG